MLLMWNTRYCVFPCRSQFMTRRTSRGSVWSLLRTARTSWSVVSTTSAPWRWSVERKSNYKTRHTTENIYLICDNQPVLQGVLMIQQCCICVCLPAGQDMSTPVSVDSSLCWRGASILTGSRGVAATPTTSRGWCPSAPSALLWVCISFQQLLSPSVWPLTCLQKRLMKSEEALNLVPQTDWSGFKVSCVASCWL